MAHDTFLVYLRTRDVSCFVSQFGSKTIFKALFVLKSFVLIFSVLKKSSNNANY